MCVKRRTINLSKKLKYDRLLFDFDVCEYNVDLLLSELQEIIDKIVPGDRTPGPQELCSVDVRCLEEIFSNQ